MAESSWTAGTPVSTVPWGQSTLQTQALVVEPRVCGSGLRLSRGPGPRRSSQLSPLVEGSAARELLAGTHCCLEDRPLCRWLGP